MKGRLRLVVFAVSWIFCHFISVCVAKVVPYLKPGFLFDYYGSGQSLSLPITAQCEAIRLKWSRGDAIGPAPIAPYFIQVFSSSFSTPFVVPVGYGPTFDWQVPFAPRTQYQICMYDVFGVSGGCQAVYTMVPSLSQDTTCQNVTAPTPLSVTTRPASGPGETPQFPVINQCSDFAIRPQSGAPPFTLTIAPSLHPPVNITSTNMNAINWTVALPEGFSFFASLASSDGLMWSVGPMRTGGLGSPDCLSPRAVPQATFTSAAIGTGFGSLVLGVLIGIASTGLFFRWRQRRGQHPFGHLPLVSKPPVIPEPIQQPSSNPPSHISDSLPIQYPPPSLPNSPPSTPDRSNFSFPTGRVTPPTRSGRSSPSIEPFNEVSSSSHFPLDVKGRRSTPSSSRRDRLSTITQGSVASSSQQTSTSSSQSNAPLMPSRTASRSSPLTRAPTYVRNPPPRHLSVSELLMDDSSLIGGRIIPPEDFPPQYMRNPTQEEISVAGGRL